MQKKLYTRSHVNAAFRHVKDGGSFKSWADENKERGLSYTAIEMIRKEVRILKYKKSTKAEKRVSIAKDVLAQIQAGSLKPTKQTYGHFPKLDETIVKVFQADVDLDDVQLNEFVQENNLRCDACAKGGLMLCYIMKENHFSLDQLSGSARFYESDIADRLREIFEPLQLDMIEAAFEGVVCEDYTLTLREQSFNGTSPVAKKCIAFNKGVRDTKERMKRIMKNIIENKGEFIP